MTLMTLDEKKETARVFGEQILNDMMQVLDADEENRKTGIACDHLSSPIVVMLTALLSRCKFLQTKEPHLAPVEELAKGIKAMAIELCEHLRSKNYDVD